MNETADPIMLSAPSTGAIACASCALIHLEQAFDENTHAMLGNAAI